MAQIKISNATVAYVNAKGFTAKAQIEVMGNTRDEYYKVWTDHKVAEGDTVDIVGDISARVEEYNDKQTGDLKRVAALHVNNPVIKSDTPF